MHYWRPLQNESSWSFATGIDGCDGFLHSRTNQTIAEMGRADGSRFSPRNPAVEGRLPSAVWNFGKARAAPSLGDRFAERALRVSARSGAGIRRGVSRILFRADFRGQARTRHRRLQHGIATEAAAGNNRRNGTEWLQEGNHRERPWRQ